MSALPNIWRANIAGLNTCTTTEGTDPKFPNLGPDVVYSGGLSATSPASAGTCDGATPQGQMFQASSDTGVAKQPSPAVPVASSVTVPSVSIPAVPSIAVPSIAVPAAPSVSIPAVSARPMPGGVFAEGDGASSASPSGSAPPVLAPSSLSAPAASSIDPLPSASSMDPLPSTDPAPAPAPAPAQEVISPLPSAQAESPPPASSASTLAPAAAGSSMESNDDDDDDNDDGDNDGNRSFRGQRGNPKSGGSFAGYGSDTGTIPGRGTWGGRGQRGRFVGLFRV